jgi:GNAT superfamily N-acetyltransferase
MNMDNASEMKVIRVIPGSSIAVDVSQFIRAEWGDLAIAEYLRLPIIKEHSELPFFLVGILCDSVVAFGGIFDNDMPDRPLLNPWLGCLFVERNFRGRGFARRIVSELLVVADSTGCRPLFLFCDPTLVRFYSQFSWVMIEERMFEGSAAVVMKRD